VQLSTATACGTQQLTLIRRLNEQIYGEYPFRFDTSELVGLKWRLGSQQRIDASAASCALCQAIVGVMDDADIRNQNPALFAGNPACQADIYRSAYLQPSPGATWKLPTEVGQGRFNGETWYFYLRRMSLKWRPFELNDSVEPGLIDRIADRVLRSWAYLDECFQPYIG
jgi:hypothetical protein